MSNSKLNEQENFYVSGTANVRADEKAYFSRDRVDNSKHKESRDRHEINLDVILDVPVVLSVEIGRTRVSIRHLLQLDQGAVVELDRSAGEPLDVLVNGTLVAHGEVVEINQKFGIRLMDVVSPTERIRKLR